MSENAKERQIPLILIGVGLAIFVLAAFTRAGAVGVASTLTLVLIISAIQTGLLIGAAFLVANFLSVSFGNVSSAILKFAAISVISGAIGVLIPFGGGLISLVIFLGLLMWLFEVELTYAIALTVVYYVIGWIVAILVVMIFR